MEMAPKIVSVNSRSRSLVPSGFSRGFVFRFLTTLAVGLSFLPGSLTRAAAADSHSLASNSGAVASDDGGWFSSGGEVFRFLHNPWFLDKNTAEFRYCVQIDSSTVSAAPDQIRSSIDDAIAYWRTELSNAGAGAEHAQASFGNAKLVEEPCQTSTPLVLKFGVGSLSPDELAYLEKAGGSNGVRSYIGVSVRQVYDLTSLRAQGFVYIASDMGPMAYHNPGHLIDRAWQSPKLLTYALIHELGHVYGFPHTGTGIMSEVFLDQLLHKRLSQTYINGPRIGFLSVPASLQICGIRGWYDARFFQAPTATACLFLEREPGPGLAWRVEAGGPTGSRQILGTVRITGASAQNLNLRPAQLIHLPENQTVFSPAERSLNNYIIGPLFNDFGADGFYRTVSSARPYSVFANVSPDRLTLLARDPAGGDPRPVLEYTGPSLLDLLVSTTP